MVEKQDFSLNLEEKTFLYKRLMRANKENGCFDLFKRSHQTCGLKQFIGHIKNCEYTSLFTKGYKKINVYSFAIHYLWQNIRSSFLSVSMENDYLVGSYCTMCLLTFVDSLRKSGYDIFDEIADYIEACELEYLLFTILIKKDVKDVNEFLKSNGVDLVAALRNILRKHNHLIGREPKLTVKNIIRNLEGKAPWEKV